MNFELVPLLFHECFVLLKTLVFCFSRMFSTCLPIWLQLLGSRRWFCSVRLIMFSPISISFKFLLLWKWSRVDYLSRWSSFRVYQMNFFWEKRFRDSWRVSERLGNTASFDAPPWWFGWGGLKFMFGLGYWNLKELSANNIL